MPPKRHLHKFDAIAVSTNCSNSNSNIHSSSSYTPTSPHSLHGNIVCCAVLCCAMSVGSLRQPRLVGRSKIFVASFSSSSLNSSRCKFLARQAVCFVVVVAVAVSGRAHLPGRGTDCFQPWLHRCCLLLTKPVSAPTHRAICGRIPSAVWPTVCLNMYVYTIGYI